MKDRLHLIRSTLQMSQTEFGKCLGVTGAAISRLEKGERTITEQSIKAVCREFNVSETWLRTGEGKMFIEISRDNQIAMWMGQVLSEEEDSFKKRLLNVLRKLDESQWVTFEAYAKELFAEEGNNKDEGKN